MGRKVICIIAIMCVCMSVTCNAFAYTSYNQGNISTTYVQYFDDIVDSLPVTHNYVASRSGQYEYILHSSDSLRLDDNGVFHSDNGTTYRITTNTGYNSTYVYNVITEPLTLDSNDQMVYSSIGNYPRLDERGSLYEYALISTAIICCIAMLIRPLFKYIMRVS